MDDVTELAEIADPFVWPALSDALRGWLPRQRWFAGKDRTVADVVVADAIMFGDPTPVVDLFVDVTYSQGGTERYQVPVARELHGDGGPQPIRVPGRQPLVDASRVNTAVQTLARRAIAGSEQRTIQDATVASHRSGLTAEGLSAPPPRSGARTAEALSSALDAGRVTEHLTRPRMLSAEQSNTSVIFDDALILKLFRRLEPGINPDVEVTRALTERGFPHVPAQRAALELQTEDGQATALAVLSDFVAGAREGWSLAVDDVTAIHRDEAPSPEPQLRPMLAELGAVIARLHTTLADAFGTRESDRADTTAWRAEMLMQAERVLDVAARHAPETVEPVLARRSELLATLETLVAQAGGTLLRVHGDLHLGQVLLDPQGQWQILDFEGEPSRSLAQRRALHSPFRDVAGMLRSFDYAAASATTDGELSLAAAHWCAESREAFLGSYLDHAETGGLMAGGGASPAEQLAAFELDKAVYELGYELANRPAWVSIPVNGILRVLDAAETGT